MQTNLEDYLNQLAISLDRNGDEEDSLQMKAYLKGQFEFFGIKAKERRLIVRRHWEEHGLISIDQLPELIKLCNDSEFREIHYFAMESTEKLKKHWPSSFLEHIEYMITHNSWWDTVDFIADNVAGPFLLKYPELMHATARKWNGSDHMWLQRSSIIFQLKYKDKTDTDLLTEMILGHNTKKEFFLRKAIGWALRQYGRTNPDWVREFVQLHPMEPLSYKEATKHL